MPDQSTYIIHCTHITENLLHHKTSDVRRILEEKGFNEGPSGNGSDATHFYPPAGTPETGKETSITFGADGFVTENGVTHSG